MTTSCLLWQLFKYLVMMCQGSNMLGKVISISVMPLSGNFKACSNVLEPFDLKSCEVVDNEKLVIFIEWDVFLFQVLFNLLLKDSSVMDQCACTGLITHAMSCLPIVLHVGMEHLIQNVIPIIRIIFCFHRDIIITVRITITYQHCLFRLTTIIVVIGL